MGDTGEVGADEGGDSTDIGEGGADSAEPKEGKMNDKETEGAEDSVEEGKA